MKISFGNLNTQRAEFHKGKKVKAPKIIDLGNGKYFMELNNGDSIGGEKADTFVINEPSNNSSFEIDDSYGDNPPYED